MLACHACNSSAMDSPYPTLAQLTYSFCLQWHADLNDKVMLANGDPVPAILLANKADSAMNAVDEALLDSYCSQHNFIGWFATSAKTGQNVAEAFEALAGRIVEVSKTNTPVQREAGIKLGEDKPSWSENVDKFKASWWLLLRVTH
eukprot:m.55213 g.55213  ORF g.55213 m.55213 type:complete len:146 (+) comp13650_c1_seq47:1226-1663(+)